MIKLFDLANVHFEKIDWIPNFIPKIADLQQFTIMNSIFDMINYFKNDQFYELSKNSLEN